MKKLPWAIALVAVAWGAKAARADTFSFTGTLSSPEASTEFVITLTSPGTVGLQTFSFGGGTNAASNVISPGGTDPFLAIFSGTGSGATILTDGSGNPYGTSLDLSNYGNPDFAGCGLANTGGPGLANTESIGGSGVCGDITMDTASLATGKYTVVLSDGQYVPNAMSDNGTLGEGFTDFTGGDFCNIEINGVACPNTSGHYALDITASGNVAQLVPEPGTLGLLSAGLLGLGLLYRRRELVPAAGPKNS
jgi:hypothetical protein